MSVKVKVAVFDLDGLILDTEESNAFIARDVLKEFGVKVPSEFIQWFYENCSGKRDSLGVLLPETFGFDKALAASFIKRFIEYRGEYYKKNPPRAKKGLIQLLEFLKANGIKIGICSSSMTSQIKVKLKAAGLSLEYFDKITGGDEVKESKPHPQIYQIACERLGVKPENAMAFEDTDLGIEAAVGAGMRVILVPDVKPNNPEIEKRSFSKIKSLDLAIPILKNII